MSSQLHSAQNEQPYRGYTKWWSTVAPYVIPPVASAAAIVPAFGFFIAKSCHQLERPVPKMRFWEVSMKGCKAAPTVGVLVGTQMIVQNYVEKILTKNSETQSPGFFTMLYSSMIVGGFSAPVLAVFNGQSMGWSIFESVKRLSIKQTSAIIAMETSFLLSIRVSKPVSQGMKKIFGDHKLVEYVSAFTSGAIGCFFGYPADTALTRWQAKLKIETVRQLMRGSPIKAAGLGIFSVGYKFVNDLFHPIPPVDKKDP